MILTQEEFESILTSEDLDRMRSEVRGWIRELIPTTINTRLVSGWAAAKRVLPAGTTAFPGSFDVSRTPYLKEIMDCLSESSDTQIVAVLKGTQVGYTVAVLENWIGYIIDEAPGPAMFVSGDQTMAEQSVEVRIDRMIDTAGLREKIKPQTRKTSNKKSGDTDALKQFPGGWLMAVGPNSLAKLRSFSQRYLALDEIDVARQGALADGDWLNSVWRRTDAFDDMKKILAGSTPLEEETSRIWALYQDGTQERYFVPCKHCGEKQALTRKRLKWDVGDDGNLIRESVHYECKFCKGHWKNYDKDWFLQPRNGAEWRPSATPKRHAMRSFHLPSIYAGVGFRSWEDIAQESIAAEGDIGKQQILRNNVDAFPWRVIHHAPSYQKVMIRRDGYESGRLPVGFEPVIYTLGADVQADRIECEIVAWSEDKRSAAVGYHVLPGNTADVSDQSWRALESILESEYHHGDRLTLALIDAGYQSDVVYEFCSQFAGGVHPVMGASYRGQRGEVYKRQLVPSFGVERIDLFEDLIKQEFYGYVQKSIYDDGTVPPGYCYFPDDYPEGYFKMLLSESRHEVRNARGGTSYTWSKIYTRNEAHDIRVYNMGALHVIAGEWARSLGLDAVDWPEFWKAARASR